MKFAIVDSNYLVYKDIVEKTLREKNYDVANSQFDIYAKNGYWGWLVFGMNPNITLKDGSVDELANNIINDAYRAVFVSLDRPNEYGEYFLHRLKGLENVYIMQDYEIISVEQEN